MLKLYAKNKNCIFSIYTQIYMNKSLLIADNLERLFYYAVFINDRK